MRSKKAQITFFIIIALILLIGASIVIYLMTQKEKIKIEEIVYPDEIKPITNFITDCTRQAGLDALNILGSQGGYIRIPGMIANDVSKYLSLDELNIRKIPFWYYEGKTVLPSINFIENQIEDFVKTDVERCLGNFNVFKAQFDIIPLDQLEIKTMIAEEDVIIETSYPLKIKSKGQLKEHLVERFVVRNDVKLKKMHDLASQILFYENENQFLENTTLSIMVAHPDVPMNGMTLDCKPQRWYLQEIKEEMQDTLKLVIPRIRIKNTVYPPFIESERFYEDLARVKKKLDRAQKEGDLACYMGKGDMCKQLEESRYYPDYTPKDAWEYTHLFYDVNAEPADLKISFQYYPEMGMDLFADPSRNGVLSTSLMKGPRKYLSMLCLNSYHFVYTLNYPVKVAIKDDTAFNNKGFIFEYAFPVLISDNLAQRENYGIMSIPSFEPADFCTSFGTEYYDFKAEGFVEQSLPPMELDDVLISYSCGRKYCALGKTSASGGEYKLRTRLPEGCNMPFIEAEKEGYLKNGDYLMGTFLTIPLKKLNKLNYKIIKHPYTEADNQVHSEQTIPIHSDDKIMIYMQIIGEDKDQFKEYPCSDCIIDFMDNTAQYNLDVFLERGGKIIGGYSAKDLEISSTEIGGKQTAVFHIYEYTPYPDTDAKQAKQAEYFTSGAYINALKPTFK